MKLTSLWTQGVVFFRLFNWDDPHHLIGNGEGTIAAVGGTMLWPEEKFQMELRKNDISGDFILEASVDRVFHDTDNLVLDDEGQVRPFLDPTLSITLPIAGAHLDQSRLGQADKASMVLNMGDMGRLVSKDDYLSDVRMFVVIKQTGFPDAEVEATIDGSVTHPILAKFDADLPIAHSGPARIIAQLRSPSVRKQLSSVVVPVTVLPTAPRSFEITIDGRSGAGVNINSSVSAPRIVVVAIYSAAPSYHGSVSIKSSLDGFRAPTPAIQSSADETRNGQSVHKWTAPLAIAANLRPGLHSLRVVDIDFFGIETEYSFNFNITDNTPPTIDIIEPREDAKLLDQTGIAAPMLVFRGTFRDTQSGGAHSLKYSFGGVSDVPVPPVNIVNDSWFFAVPFPPIGSYELTMTATDAAGNTGPRLAVRQFEVVWSYKPKSIDELLCPTAYLNELLRFTRSHILKGNSPVDGALVLSPAFKQPFNEIAQPDVPANERLVSDLLMPVRILRDMGLDDPDAIDAVGLIARWTFSEIPKGAMDGEPSRAGRFAGGRPKGIYQVNGSNVFGTSLDHMRGLPGTPMEEAIVLDGFSSLCVNTSPVLELGRDNRDFSVSFWIYPKDTGNGTWRQVLYKGLERVVNEMDGWVEVEGNRTFGIWLHEHSNKVYFCISTITTEYDEREGRSNWNQGGDSKTPLVVNRWSHLAYVKFGRVLKLYINGQLDTEVELPTDVISNTDPLYIGKSPYFDSFKGGLAELRLYGFALGSADIEQLALDRRAGLTETPVADYHEAVYEALLVGLGTSLEELRGLNALSADQRRALAERLGLLNVGPTGDTVNSLLFGNILPGTEAFELKLAAKFGLPLTFTPENPWDVPGGVADVVYDQHESLLFQWVSEDTQQVRTPELDPDLFDLADISPNAQDWLSLLRSRSVELAVKFKEFDTLLRAGSAANGLSQVYSSDELDKLKSLYNSEKAGEPIAQELPRFNLDRKMFRRLLAYMSRLDAVLTAHERDDFAHLLTQLWKVRNRYTVWKQAEAALGSHSRLWPTLTTEAAWMPGSYKRDFLPWRGNAQQRSEMEARLANRLRAWQTIQEAQERAVAEAQRIALPLLRDGLLGIADLPAASQRMDDLTERWLVDFAATSATFVTQIDQATLSLQTLINGIRNGWYEASHVASKWTIKPEYLANFDAEWQWLGTYGSWRAAVLSYLYPESILFPDLRKKKSDLNPQGSTPNFIAFLGELRKLQPITSDSLETPLTAYRAAKDLLGGDESLYFAPMAIGLALQRAGLYPAALDEYSNVYDTSKSGAARKIAPWLKTPNENDSQPPAPFFDDRWTLKLTDPHAVALLTYSEGSNVKRVWGNPYTRYTLIQIVHCLLAQADGEFAAGTKDARNKALSLYLEAKEVLAFDELRDLQPEKPEQAYLPNPVLAAKRAHVDVSLRKLRRGLSFLGTPLPPDLTRGPNAGAVSNLVRPTPYRFKVLIERAKQLAAQAQNFESQYLSAIERGEGEAEKLMRENFISEIAGQTVTLRQLGEREAKTGKGLAELQRSRSQIQADRYQGWLSTGQNENERLQMEAIEQASTSRQVINVADAVISTAQAAQTAAGLIALVESAGVKAAIAFTIGAAVGTKVVAQGFLIDQETRSQLSGIRASQERREQEWQLQRDLSRQDVLIGNQQVTAADDRVAIAAQESVIARMQLDQAHQMLTFLNNKFTSVEFYQWLTGVLSEVYAFFLRTAASNAQQAELQLAFERQEAPARLIKPDYWLAASQPSAGKNANSAPDRRGISGSARLLQDLYTLDQQAFSSERRMLNLAQSFLLSRLMPLEFEEFRRTGLLAFSTPMQWFDEGLPGHYMRLIKRARISVAALIPPSQGIRATFTNGGLSRVVTADPGYPTVVVRQDPQSVSLTSPVSATGVFELDVQSELLFPFEGTGVDTTWFFELPPAGNPFDFDTIAEVVLTVEYTALMSYELRDRVVKKLPRRWSGDISFSVRRDLPDVWYELSNPTSEGVLEIELELDTRFFPSGISNRSIDEVALSLRLRDSGYPVAYVLPTFIPQNSTTPVVGTQSSLVKGLVSSTQSGASSWSALRGSAGTAARWKFQLSDVSASDFSLREAFQESNVDDITVVFTVSGMRPAWST